MIKRCHILISVVLAALFIAGTSSADDYHYTNLLVGERASGMGGAYVAVSDDATGLYYNPAGAVYTAGRSLSASVNAYYDSVKTYKGVIGGNGWTRRSSSLLPNYFGVVQPVGSIKLGISYAVPESLMENQDQTFTNLPLNPALVPFNPPGTFISSYIINFNNESNVYNFGPSIAMELNSKISTGLTLYYYQKRTMWILNQLIKTSNGGYEWTNDKYLLEEWGWRPVLGFMLTPADSFSVGLAVSKIFIWGSNTMTQHSLRAEGIAPSETNLSVLPDGQTNFSQKRNYPTQISLGVAWFPSPSLLLSADLNYFTQVDEQDVTVNGQTYAFRPLAKAVTNFALGTEYYFSKTWAMRAGLFSDYANTPKISSSAAGQNEHIDIYGGTLSFSHFTRNTSVTLGTGYTMGEGKAQITGGSNIQDATTTGWMIFLSSSYSY